MNLIFPMAGLSHRFAVAGYERPKYMLDLHGKSVFRHVVESFAAYFQLARFVFIVRDAQGTPAFVRRECVGMGITNFAIRQIDQFTRGQAETVALGLAGITADDAPLTIFNIDTFRPRWKAASFDHTDVDGYLAVFRDSGVNWSFVRPADDTRQTVAETAEKRPISDLCCTGLYHFRRYDAYLRALACALAVGPDGWTNGELFVAPLYNYVIADGADVRYVLVPRDEVICCGTPEEYENLKVRFAGKCPADIGSGALL
jgi:hypothetical protein